MSPGCANIWPARLGPSRKLAMRPVTSKPVASGGTRQGKGITLVSEVNVLFSLLVIATLPIDEQTSKPLASGDKARQGYYPRFRSQRPF